MRQIGDSICNCYWAQRKKTSQASYSRSGQEHRQVLPRQTAWALRILAVKNNLLNSTPPNTVGLLLPFDLPVQALPLAVCVSRWRLANCDPFWYNGITAKLRQVLYFESNTIYCRSLASTTQSRQNSGILKVHSIVLFPCRRRIQEEWL